MEGYKREEIHIVTTPAELRGIAKDMETMWPKLLLGDFTTARVFIVNDIIVKFDMDQTKMNEHMRRWAE